MKRRDFIRLGGFLTVSAAALGVTGCSLGGDNSNETTDDNDGNTYPNPSRPMPAAATGATWQFPQSVASGDPKSESIVLWTRLLAAGQPATANASGDYAINLKVTAADNNGALGANTALTGALVADVMVPAYADFDGTVRHKLTGLSPDTVYYYQFTAGEARSNIGRFKTAPAASATRDVRFAFMSCQDWSANHWGAFTQIVNDDIASPADLDFIVHLGDYIYETDNNGLAGIEAQHPAVVFPAGATLPPSHAGAVAPVGNYATARNDYRFLYKLYRSDKRLRRMHERFPMVAVWDDHEFSDDSWQTSETYTNVNNPQYERRRNANQAWFEFMPADVTFQEVNPSFQNIRLYRDLKFGAVVHLVMTDERLYRADHLIPENTLSPVSGNELGPINSRYLAPESSLKQAEGIKDAASPNLALISMLGATQREWWKTTMQSSSATWKVWGNEVSLLRMGLDGSKAVGTLIALQTLSSTDATMTAQLSNSQVQSLPKVAAGAGAAVGAGAASATAIQGSFAILAAYASSGGNAATAVAAGEAAGLTNAQANAALTAIGSKTPTSAETAICAATVVAAATAYMTVNMAHATAQTTAAGNTVALLLTDNAYGGAAPAAALLPAARGSTGLGDEGGSIVVDVYNAAKDAAASGQSAQVTAAATAFAAGGVMLTLIRTEVETYKATSAFVIASGKLATLGLFLRKFLINADQWDGYGKERAQLMDFLVDNGIGNVVAITGDIHAFFAGTVHGGFKGEVLTVDGGGNEATAAAASSRAAMVDLVTAGVSSTSWFSYLKAAAASLSADLVTLVSATVPAASTGLPFDVTLPVLDFSLGKPYSVAALTTMARDAVKRGAAENGIPESNLGGDAAISGMIAPGIAGSAQLQSLCAALATMGTAVNPWLSHVDSNAQGYAVVTASTSSLKCDFKRLNTVFITGGSGYAPGVMEPRAIVDRTVTATVTAGTAAVVMS